MAMFYSIVRVTVTTAVILIMTFSRGCAAIPCVEVDPISGDAYVDWPFRLDCRYLEDIWRTQNTGVNLQLANTTCSINEDMNSFEPMLYEFNKTGARTFNLTMVLNETQCLTSLMTVRISPFPNITCQEFLNESKRNGVVIEYETTYGESFFRLQSCPPSTQVNVASSALTGDNFETVWIWSCDPVRERTYRTPVIQNEATNSGCPDNLLFGTVVFFDGGDYVSAVKYKNKTLFVSSRSVCVKRDIIDERPSVICSPTERFPAGDDGVVVCDATVPNGPTLPGEMFVQWRKGDTTLCSNLNLNERVDGGKHSCSTTGENNSISCVYNEGDEDRYTKKISLQLTVRDLSGNDFGEYTVKITYRDKNAEISSNLSEDLAPFFARLAVILGLLFIVVAAIVATILYYKRNTLEVQLRWIKLRGYQMKGRRVYLSYFFDGFSMDNKEQIMMNSIVETISMEADCYDITRDGIPGLPVAEHVPTKMLACHTTLVVITSRYIECAERQFDAEQAFGQLLELRKRMVIIVTPDGYKALQRRDLDDVWPKISLAIKIFGAFSWTNDSDSTAQELRKYIRKQIKQPTLGVRYLADRQEQIFYQNNNTV